MLRTRYDTIDELRRDFPALQVDEVELTTAKPYDIKDLAGFVKPGDAYGFSQPMARRRLFFWAVRPLRLLPYVATREIAKKTEEVTRTIWDAYGNPRQVTVERTYVMYELDPDRIGIPSAGQVVYALVMTCPSTGQQYLSLAAEFFLPSINAAIRSMAPDFPYNHRQGDVYIQAVPVKYLQESNDDNVLPFRDRCDSVARHSDTYPELAAINSLSKADTYSNGSLLITRSLIGES